MKHLLLKFTSVLLVSAVIFTSCAKDGEMGPPGEQGEQGPQGPAGPAGPKGDTGVANVIYSDWIDVEFGENEDGDVIGGMEAPKLTQSILNTGEVKVFCNLGTNTAGDPLILPVPCQLPATYFGGEAGDANFAMSPIYTTGFIALFILNGWFIESAPFRYILIPGGVEGRKMNGKSVNFDNYEEVKSYLGLKD